MQPLTDSVVEQIVDRCSPAVYDTDASSLLLLPKGPSIWLVELPSLTRLGSGRDGAGRGEPGEAGWSAVERRGGTERGADALDRKRQ